MPVAKVGAPGMSIGVKRSLTPFANKKPAGSRQVHEIGGRAARDLAAVVDAEGDGVPDAGRVDGGDATALVRKNARWAGVGDDEGSCVPAKPY
jgi:hypothetical protein